MRFAISRRVLVVSALALVTALALPTAEGQAQGGEEIPTAKLTYRTQVGPNEATRLIRISALGPAPASAKLVDATGELVVTATAVHGGGCDTARILQTALGDDVWCLRLRNVAAGAPVVGVLEGTSSTVELTIEARHHWGNPTLFAILMLLVSALLVWLTTSVVPRALAAAQLKWLSRSDKDISGLNQWAATAQTNKLSTSDVVSRLRWAKTHGAARIKGIRSSLQQLVDQPALDGAPLRDSAASEASVQQVAVTDLLTPTGDIAISKAERLLNAYSGAAAVYDEFVELGEAMTKAITDPDRRKDAEAALNAGRTAHRGFLTVRNVDRWEQTLYEQLEEIRKQANVAHTDASIGMVAAADSAAATSRSRKAIDGPAAALALAGASAAAVALALVLMVIATVTVLAGTYLPDETFGTASDYISLAVAAVGSSSVVGAVTLLLLLRPANSWNA